MLDLYSNDFQRRKIMKKSRTENEGFQYTSKDTPWSRKTERTDTQCKSGRKVRDQKAQ